MSEKNLEWALAALRDKAFGGKSGFDLDEIVPTLERGVELLKQAIVELEALQRARIFKLENNTIYQVSGEVTYQMVMRLRGFIADKEGIQFVICPRDIVFKPMTMGPPMEEIL
jgi:hypothetical protein